MNPPLLRLIDANANRAREALRVLEDFARFVLNDKALCCDLKSIRHDLRHALGALLPHALLCRDTAGDVGTANKTPAELARADLSDIVTAAGKRLGEALRAIEEYAKVVGPDVSPLIESLRYRFYDLETRLARRLHPKSRLSDSRLCVLITESACRGDWFDTAVAAIDGGADMLQLREKDLEGAELLCRAKRFVELCRSRGVIAIVNDRPDIALLADADGVHLGQGDLPLTEARKLLGPSQIIGVSTHTLDHARQAQADGADYIGVGPIFPSPTKPRDFLPGLDFGRQVADNINLPAYAIAGITIDNLDEVLATGLKRIAVTQAVTNAQNPRAAAVALKRKLATDGATISAEE